MSLSQMRLVTVPSDRIGAYEPGLDVGRQLQLPFTLLGGINEALSWLEQDDS
jgi:hypothetical protein